LPSPAASRKTGYNHRLHLEPESWPPSVSVPGFQGFPSVVATEHIAEILQHVRQEFGEGLGYFGTEEDASIKKAQLSIAACGTLGCGPKRPVLEDSLEFFF
jgi:hypothetical protein